MVINGTAVLAFGIVSVLGVAVHNNHRVNAASPPVAVEVAAVSVEVSTRELPRGYLTNAATSPLAGFTTIVLPPARPILRSDTRPVAPAVFAFN